jgi:Protein of unknown function (DUF2961)
MATLAEIQGLGAIQHMWMAIHPDKWRRLVIRIFWDGEEHPSIKVPLGDFFCNGWVQRLDGCPTGNQHLETFQPLH